MHRSALRLIQAAIFAIGVSIIPLATVSACSCAMTELDEAVTTADLAIIATATSTEPVAGGAETGELQVTTWEISQSREDLDTDVVEIVSAKDNGANCGISFGTEERWLVLAYPGERGLETNGCMQNRRLDGSDPAMEAAIASMFPAVTTSEEPAASEAGTPTTALAVSAAVVLLAALGAIALRRRASS